VDLDKLREAAFGLAAEAVRDRSHDAVDPEYWRRLSPPLSVCGPPPERAAAPVDLAVARQFADAGYCSSDPVLGPARTQAVVTAVEALKAAGWPPLFALVYDELWGLVLNDAARTLAEAILEAPAHLASRVAVHHVDRAARARGWSPHVDRIGEGRVSMWIPITDATLDNGCMYVVPRHAETDAATQRFMESALVPGDTATLLHHARALPAPAGSLLCWREDVIHWGSVASAASTPRISAAFEWLAPGAPLQAGESELVLEAGGLPAFTSRLHAIATAIPYYSHMDPRLAPFEGLADVLRAA
jgi:hypothetical protein